MIPRNIGAFEVYDIANKALVEWLGFGVAALMSRPITFSTVSHLTSYTKIVFYVRTKQAPIPPPS